MWVAFGYFFHFWLSWASLASTWASLASYWAALGSFCASLASSWASLGSSWGHLGSLLTRIGSLLAHPGPAVPHLEPLWSRHRDSLASSWSLSWPTRLPLPIFPSAVASGCIHNQHPAHVTSAASAHQGSSQPRAHTFAQAARRAQTSAFSASALESLFLQNKTRCGRSKQLCRLNKKMVFQFYY